MTYLYAGFARSGNHWLGNILKHYDESKFSQTHEKYRSDLNYEKAVYIKRHPAGIIESSMRAFKTTKEDIDILKRWDLCDWKEHVNSWSSAPNILIVEYESLMKDTIKEFKKILDFFEIKYIDDELKKVIEYYSVSNIKARSEEPTPVSSWNGMNNWKNKLSPKFIKQIEERYIK